MHIACLAISSYDMNTDDMDRPNVGSLALENLNEGSMPCIIKSGGSMNNNTATNNKNMMVDVCAQTSYYKAAISLSNTGISMLQRRCYSEATATFRDALELMRGAADPVSWAPIEGEARMNQLLREASRRFADVLSQATKPDLSPNNALSVLILSDDLTSDFVQTAMREPSLRPEAVAIRIDDKKDADSSERFQFDSAIVLFNYATATRCLAAVTTSPNPLILQAAYKCYHMSYAVLTKIQSSKDVAPIDELQSIRIHLIAMLAVQHLAASAMELQLPQKAQEYYNLLCGLKAIYKRFERIPRMLNSAKRVAPAA